MKLVVATLDCSTTDVFGIPRLVARIEAAAGRRYPLTPVTASAPNGVNRSAPASYSTNKASNFIRCSAGIQGLVNYNDRVLHYAGTSTASICYFALSTGIFTVVKYCEKVGTNSFLPHSC
jgi:hypothetical protein